METMDEKINISMTMKQLEVMYAGLFELPTKVALSVIQELERQIKAYTDSKNETTDK
jgi:hypothetical protein